jgi:hypothetical protein
MMKKILTFIFCLLTYMSTACDLSSLSWNTITPLGGNQWQVDMTLCAASGSALANTGNFLFVVTGANVVSAPPTITSPQYPDVDYTGVILGNTVEYTNAISWYTTTPGAPISQCTSVTMVLDDYPTQVEVFGLEGADSYVAGCIEGFILPPLPIDLVYFIGYSDEDCSNTLKWETETEVDASHFIVQRSYDGVEFANIGYVFSSEEDAFTPNQYRFIDTEPLESGYYRLTMVDDDGATKSSTTIQLTSLCESDILFPNPTNGSTSVDYILVSSSIKDVNIMVTDYLGKIVRWETDTISNQTNRFSFDLTGLPKGIYFIVIDSGELVKRRPFILN